MRILEVIMDNRLGGIAQRAMLVADELRALGHETIFLTPNEPGDIAKICADKGYATHQPLLKRPHNKRFWQSVRWLFSFPISVWQIRRIIRQSKADVVHLNGFMSLQSAVAARWAGAPIVWHFASTSYPKWLVRFLMPWIAKRAHVISIAQGVRDYFLEGLPVTENESIIYEPIDFGGVAQAIPYPDEESFRKQLGLPQESSLVLSIGNLSARKGFDYVVEAAALLCKKHPNLYFAFVGGKLDTQKAFISELEESIRRHQLEDRIILTGERRDIFRILKEADAFLLASLDEGTPLSILEAMASNVPVIATSVGGIPDQIDDGETGLLIPPRDSDAIENAVDWLLTHPQEAAAFVQSAKTKVHQRFSMEQFLERFLEVLHSVQTD